MPRRRPIRRSRSPRNVWCSDSRRRPHSRRGRDSGCRVRFRCHPSPTCCFADPGRDPGPGHESSGVGNPVMSTPTSAMMTCAMTTPIPGISSRRATVFAKRGHLLIDRGLHRVDVRVEAVDPGQQVRQENQLREGSGRLGSRRQVSLKGQLSGHPLCTARSDARRPGNAPNDQNGQNDQSSPALADTTTVAMPGSGVTGSTDIRIPDGTVRRRTSRLARRCCTRRTSATRPCEPPDGDSAWVAFPAADPWTSRFSCPPGSAAG